MTGIGQYRMACQLILEQNKPSFVTCWGKALQIISISFLLLVISTTANVGSYSAF